MSNETQISLLRRVIYNHQVDLIESLLKDASVLSHKDQYGNNILHLCIISALKNVDIPEAYTDCKKISQIILNFEKQVKLNNSNNFITLKNQKNNEGLSPVDLVKDHKIIKHDFFPNANYNLFNWFSNDKSRNYKSNAYQKVKTN